jgi:hypothetical protein
MATGQHIVSGSSCYIEGAATFCYISGSVSMLGTHGLPVFSALEVMLRRQPLLPSFSET